MATTEPRPCIRPSRGPWTRRPVVTNALVARCQARRARSPSRPVVRSWRELIGEIFDHGVCQEAAAHLRDQHVSRALISRAETDLEDLSGANALDVGKAELTESTPNRQALRVVDRG